MNVMVKKLCSFLQSGMPPGIQAQQVRQVQKLTFVDARMLKDYKKRKEFEKFGKQRLRLNALRKNKILPPELQAIADEEIAALPRYSCKTQLVSRCTVTSRSLGIVSPYRVSRIIFRHLADYNFLAGWQRARW